LNKAEQQEQQATNNSESMLNHSEMKSASVVSTEVKSYHEIGETNAANRNPNWVWQKEHIH
jgi:hypothetical protein